MRELNEELRLWDVLVDPPVRSGNGNKLYFGDDDSMVAEVIDNTTSRGRTLPVSSMTVRTMSLRGFGMRWANLLPHSIINRPVRAEDSSGFSNLSFARNEGAVTAPTASLHFSRELMKRLEIKGIDFAYITLHASLK